MTTVVIDENNYEGRAFLELLRKMKFAEVLDSTDDDWWDEISPAERKAIERGLEDIKAGKTVPHEEVKKIYAKWL